MKDKKFTQRGQALVLIALAIVGLVGFTALAIDGSRIFSDRRHSQNASDTAALAAALALTRAESNWKDFGFDRAVSNGYDPTDGVTGVDVHLCSELPVTIDGFTLTCRGLPTGAEPAEYVHVHIKSEVDLFFARVVGWRTKINHTDAVVHAKEQEETSLFPGFAIVSTMMDCPSSPAAFEVSGSSGTVVTDAGILVNSNCDGSPKPAYDQSGSSHVETDPDHGVCVVGDADATNTDPPPTEGCSPVDFNNYTLPNPFCSHEGQIVEQSNGVYIATPGNYGNSYAFDSIDDVNPNGELKLQKGIYCFYDGIALNSQWDITTDLNNNGAHDSLSEGVFFFVPGGNVIFNGSSNVDIHAIDTTADEFPEEFVNFLIYMPPSNPSTLTFTGGAGSQFTGTILAPASEFTFNGDLSAIGLDSQIIGYAVKINGNGTLDVTYNPDNNATTTTNPGLEQTE